MASLDVMSDSWGALIGWLKLYAPGRSYSRRKDELLCDPRAHVAETTTYNYL